MIRLANNPLIQRLAQWLSRPLSSWGIALALLLVAVLAYGIHIPAWGLYGDDWIYLYSYHATGAGGFVDFVRVDRPFSFWIYSLITPVLGESVYPYHVLLLVVRWVGAVLLTWLVRLIAPRQPHLSFGVGILFLVYPGFSQQPVALQFILHFTVLALTIYSFAAMIKSVQVEHPWAWRATSWFSALVSLFSVEYFFGYELLRPLVLWIACGGIGLPHRARARRVIAAWLPYLALAASFVIWRVFIFKFAFYQPETLDLIRTSPATGLLALAGRMLADLKIVLFDAWRQTLVLPVSNRITFVILALFGFLLTIFAGSRVIGRSSRSGGFNFVWFSLVLLLAAGIPFWMTDIPVELAFPWDRSTLPFMLGAAIFTTGILEWLLRPIFLPYALALLTAMAVGYHSMNAQVYAAEWRAMREYFWQLTWRAPDLKEGTILLSDEIPLFKHSDNDLTPIVNWTYRPDLNGTQYTYQYFDLSTRVEPPIPSYQPGQEVIKGYRSFRFNGTTDSLLALHWRQPNCLQVIDPHRLIHKHLPDTLMQALPYTRLEVIEDGYAAPPSQLFGKEPERGWCYYFQKAEWARQQYDWLEVTSLGSEAAEAGLTAGQTGEYLPFLQAAIASGDQDEAEQWHNLMMNTPGDTAAICAFWDWIPTQGTWDPGLLTVAEKARQDLGCQP